MTGATAPDILSAMESSGDTKLSALAAELAGSQTPYKPAQALLAFERGDFSAALALCEETLTEPEAPLSAQLLAGRCNLALARFSAAAECFHQTLTCEPENTVALKGLGDIHFARGSAPVALSYYQRVIELLSDRAALCQPLAAPECRALRDRHQRTIAAQKPLEKAPAATPPAAVSSNPDPQPEPEPAPPTEPEFAEIDISEEIDEAAEDNVETVSADSPEQAAGAPHSAPPQSVTLKRPAEETPVASRATFSPRDFQRYDRLNLPPQYHTETMADLLMRQGHHRAAVDILKELVKREAAPRLVEKLKSAESAAQKKGK
ncbi:MAG TPA: tetratricopeptide repeat protein [candidate division Zixibacteria bacterium]|nr:tetratricopeptide repeat protein [candidate division Zixibacteria bacterium]